MSAQAMSTRVPSQTGYNLNIHNNTNICPPVNVNVMLYVVIFNDCSLDIIMVN